MSEPDLGQVDKGAAVDDESAVHHLVAIAVIFAILLSPLMIVGLRSGLYRRRLEIQGLPSPLEGRAAMVVGGLLVVIWAVVSLMPILVTVFGIARR